MCTDRRGEPFDRCFRFAPSPDFLTCANRDQLRSKFDFSSLIDQLQTEDFSRRLVNGVE